MIKMSFGIVNMLLWLCEKKPWRNKGVDLPLIGEAHEVPKQAILTRKDMRALHNAKMESECKIGDMVIKRDGTLGIVSFVEVGEGSLYVVLANNECEKNFDDLFLFTLKEYLSGREFR